MTKDQIIKLTSTQGLKVGDILGDMCVSRGETPIDYYKYTITRIDGNRIKIDNYSDWYYVHYFFKLEESPAPIKRGHKLTTMFNFSSKI